MRHTGKSTATSYYPSSKSPHTALLRQEEGARSVPCTPDIGGSSGQFPVLSKMHELLQT